MTTLEHRRIKVGQLGPMALYLKLLAGQPLFILDVRNEIKFARNQIRVHNRMGLTNMRHILRCMIPNDALYPQPGYI